VVDCIDTGKLADKKVVIIGSGIGGAAMAALLARRGARPTVLERSALVGGKAGSYLRKGFNMEVGIHISPRGRRGPLGEVARRTGADVTFADMDPTFNLIYGDRSTLLRQNLGHPASLINLLRTVRPSLSSSPGLLKFAALVLRSTSEADVARLHGVSAHHVISQHIKDPDMHAFLNYCSGIMFVLSTREVSASQFLMGLNHWFLEGETAYPLGGYGKIPQAYLDVCTSAGGVVHLKEKVTAIEVRNGAVTGVHTKTAFHAADIVISNAGIVQTSALVDQQALPETYRERIGKLVDSESAVVIKYALDRRFARSVASLYMPKRFDANAHLEALRSRRKPPDTPLFIISPTVADPGLAPPGKHILLACTGAVAQILDKDINELLLDQVEMQLQKLYPGIERSILFKERHGTAYLAAIGGRSAGEAIGLAQRYDQDGDNRFSPRTPVKGLYVVGADTGPYGIGTERAALSALVADAMIANDAVGRTDVAG